MRGLLAAVLILGLAACTDEDAAIQTLVDAGYTRPSPMSVPVERSMTYATT
jgi:hypothetical protein